MKIPLSRVYIDDEIKQSVIAAIDSQNFILGKQCEAFEQELAAYTGVKHCVLSSSWTAAVHLLLLSLKVKAGDEILVPSHTAFPSIEPIVHVGAKPVFVDVDETYTVDIKELESKISPRTVGILAVHLYGHPFNIPAVKALADRHQLFWIEDCAQAQGATFQGKQVGSHGTFGAFSFFPSKNLTVFGDGGCITTNDTAIAEHIRMLRNHGRKDKYLHQFVGFNMRFNEMQAAVGRHQLRHLDAFNAKRRQVVEWYRGRLGDFKEVQFPVVRKDCSPVYHMFVVQVSRREELAKHLKDQGIGTGVHYPIPNHRQPAMTSLYKDLPKLPVTEALVDRILSLPMYPHMTEAEVDFVCVQIKGFYGK